MLIIVPLLGLVGWGVFCFSLQQLFLFLPYQDTGRDEDLSEWEWGHPVSEMLDVIPRHTTSAITCLSLLEHLWLFCEHKITGGMSACSPPFPPMVCRHRSLTNTVATALSCSNNIEFGTRIIYCTKASCICAKRLLWSCFLKAWWLSVFNAVLPLHLGC